MKRLLLFAGLPGVGKSTISRGVSKKTDTMIVDLDDFKKTDVDPVLVKHEIDPPDLRWSYYQKALEYVFGRFDEGLEVAIMDEVFHLHSLRTQLESCCVDRHVQVTWIEIQCPYEVVKKRLQATARTGHILTTEESLNMYLRFQDIFEAFPASTENRITVNNEGGADIDSLVDWILSRG
ncbi:MAG: hypothetical protein A3E36_00720 [Candidatus Andersenbacteria bacterium RIFCSPHIGHO2_12_FULL_45_11b]|uniref:Uncharacterized protein n=1 Tax=Candidatus Andersenbacteria bacterium RIFCSPHIGHO2_12_FULL_45_11b TaxID=1797282 RepID=A0A1G1X5C5_9BACT|nr:MAG: hypothetical protein A3E36_00720 [Candidatus Andersenbacteria bacterium RIFCSPHIGHO2_12_FULL_45_11b]